MSWIALTAVRADTSGGLRVEGALEIVYRLLEIGLAAAEVPHELDLGAHGAERRNLKDLQSARSSIVPSC